MSTVFNQFLKEICDLMISKSESWEIEIKQKTNQLLLNIIRAQIIAIDEAFFNSPGRIKQYLSKDTVTRTITFSFGTLTFVRRKYKCRHSQAYYYPVDEMLLIEKYERFSRNVKAELLQLVSGFGLSYEKSATAFDCSKTFVSQLMASLTIDELTPALSEKISCDYLHVMADEDHIALQTHRDQSTKSNSHLIKHVTLFTDIQKVGKNRNKLVNKVILTPYENESNEAFCERVDHFIYENYDITHETYVYGDGANWIKALAQQLNVPFILDKFHMLQALMRIAGGKKNRALRKVLQKLLEENKKEAFFEAYYAHYDVEHLSDFKKRNLEYIKNQWNNYQRNFSLPKAHYCCAEGINSHVFAARLSSRPKGFSKKNAHHLAFINALNHSDLPMIASVYELLPKQNRIRNIKQKHSVYFNPITPTVISRGLVNGIYKNVKSAIGLNR